MSKMEQYEFVLLLIYLCFSLTDPNAATEARGLIDSNCQTDYLIVSTFNTINCIIN